MNSKYLITLLCVLFLFSCKDDEEMKQDDPIPTEEIIEITTDHGRMVLWLFKETKLHHDNFLKLAKEDFYDSTEFHRLVKDFVIQGGDPNSKDEDRTNDGSGGPGYTIPQEIDSSMFKHNYGSLAAARLSDDVNPERASSGSQFYIVTDPNGEPQLDGKYTVFGKVLHGMDVAITIQNQRANLAGRPYDRIPMDVNVLNYTLQQLKDSFDFVP